jgi:hypothetical protein
MPPDTEPLEDTEDSAAYRWTIRALYAAALAMNIYVLWQASMQDYEYAVIRQKIVAEAQRILRPIRAKREWQKNVAWLHWQAREIVEEST